MDKGTYAAASAGLVQLRRLDIVANNIANVNTPGFKRQTLISEGRRFEATLAKEFERQDPYARGDHDRTPGIGHIGSATDFSLGPVRQTGNHLDAALRDPNQFFVVNTPEGALYTRAGNFTVNVEGSLVTQDGFEVAGDGGAITAPGPGVQIAPSGAVRSNGAEVGRLQVVKIDKLDELVPAGGTRYRLKAGAAAPEAVDADLLTQSLEMSNVSAVSGMIEMMSANKAFDMYSKTAQTIDQMNQTAIQQVGRRGA